MDNYSVYFTKEEEQKAIEIRREEDKIPGNQNFGSDSRWVGKLGEWAFGKSFPDFHQFTKDFTAQNYDFIHPITKEKTEVKANSGIIPFSPYFSLTLDYAQFQIKPYELIVYCYYHLSPTYPRKLTIVGFNRRKLLLDNSIFHPNGKTLYTSKGTKRFTVKNPVGCYEWDLKHWLAMKKIYD